MKKSIVLILITGALALTGCGNSDTNDNNCTSNLDYPEVEEKYKVITVPMVQREDLGDRS